MNACSSPQYQTLRPEVYDAEDEGVAPFLCVSSVTRRDDDGALLSKTESLHGRFSDVLEERFDLDGDGHFERVIEQLYNEAGQLIERQIDEDGDGEMDRRETLTYRNGYLIEHAFDDDLDFFADRITLYAYTDDGAPTLISIDDDGDFVPEHLERFTYVAGRLVERRQEDFGETTFVEMFSYQENRMRHEIDEDGDGQWEWVHESLDGRRLRTLMEQDGDGRVDGVTEYEYDAQERLLSVIKVGVQEVSTFYFYGEHGRLRQVDVDEGNDGLLEGQERYGYEGPFLTLHSIDREGDGRLEWYFRAEVDGSTLSSAHSTQIIGEQRIESTIRFGEGSQKTSERKETWSGERLIALRAQTYVEGRLTVERLDADADGVFEDNTRIVFCD